MNFVNRRDAEGSFFVEKNKRDDLGADLSEKIIACAIDVHRELGPGLLEGIYESCLVLALKNANISFEVQKNIPIFYRGQKIDKTYCVDLIVEDHLIVELKAVDSLSSIHRAQLMTYMKLTGKPLGLLINFNETLLKNGIRRVALSTDASPSASLRLNHSEAVTK